MGIGVARIHHVQITVPRALEEATKRFYGQAIGLEEIPKPESARARGGAWYRGVAIELHVGIEEIDRAENARSKRHVCFLVEDLERAKRSLRDDGIEIIADPDPVEGWKRFYVRDPGGTRVEIAVLT